MQRLSYAGMLAAVLALGCIPAHLQKYRKSSDVADDRSTSNLAGPNAEIRRQDSGFGSKDSKDARANSVAGADAPQRATIYAIDAQTFRFLVREDDVWDGALRVLLKNYNVNIIQKDSGVITTEWDTYYLENSVYRNKVSLHVRRVSRDAVDVTIRNNVEKLQDGAITGSVGAVWLPGEDPANEVGRIVQNMALALNQPPPVMPPSMVAKSLEEKDTLAE